jgi:hypothetical protein
MIPAFVLGELGFGYNISADNLVKVNEKRQGKHLQ